MALDPDPAQAAARPDAPAAPVPRPAPSAPVAEGASAADSLDPEIDFEAIARRLALLDFSWDIEKALEFALFRTYAVPSISGLLAKTGEFELRPRKRYDDTALILGEAAEHGLDSPRGRQAIGRMNEMHGRYRISNDDMLYVLSTFVCEPIRWLARFGRRPMTPAEAQAWFLYYRALGQRMKIREIPADLDAMMRFNRDYEAARFRFADSNRRIGLATADLLLGFYLPRRLVPLGRPAIAAVMDPPLREAMGFPAPPGWVARLTLGGLSLRARALRRLPRRRRPRLPSGIRRATYPDGWTLAEVGTFR